jgi:hypothetical protein
LFDELLHINCRKRPDAGFRLSEDYSCNLRH